MQVIRAVAARLSLRRPAVTNRTPSGVPQTAAVPRRPRVRRLPQVRLCLPRAVPRWLAVTLALAAALAAFGAFAHDTYTVGPASVTVGAAPALRGSTTLRLPPFGTVAAPTHAAPLALTASLEEIDLPALRDLAGRGVPEGAERDGLFGELRAGLAAVILRGLAAAALAAALVVWALRRRWRETLAVALAGIVLPTALLGWAYAGFEPQAFSRPEYRGALTYAPSLIELARNRVERVEDLRGQIDRYARELSSYYASPQSFGQGGAMTGTYRVLHVSDLHLDPVGMQLASSLADDFKADLVLDTGDVANYGTEIEAEAVGRLYDKKHRVLFVPGNHESTITAEGMRRMRNVSVLTSGTTTIDGLTVMGLADIEAGSLDWETDQRAERRAVEAAAGDLRERIEAGAAEPDIVAMHNPAGWQAFDGLAPVVAAGHTHKPALRHGEETVRLNAGTTGGVLFGAREQHIPHTAAILYYTESLPRRLIAIDQIAVYGVGRQSSVKRTVIDPTLLPKPGTPIAEAPKAVR